MLNGVAIVFFLKFFRNVISWLLLNEIEQRFMSKTYITRNNDTFTCLYLSKDIAFPFF